MFTNDYDDTLIITQQPVGDGPNAKSDFIYPGETITVKSYPGYMMHIKKTDRLSVIYSIMVVENNKAVILERNMPPLNLEPLRQQEHTKMESADYQIAMHLYRHVQMNKQPIFVHNYTQEGYKKQPMSEDLISYLKTFFSNNYSRRRDELLTKNELLVVNKGDVRTSMVDLSDEAVEYAVERLKPILEQWCKCELKFNQAYGIREYYAGNVLHKHVDSVITHVISAILQVDQQLEGEDWTLETIGWDGRRTETPMKVGDMVMYESARLIHGRPKVFQGRSYANCFFHFSPVNGWNYAVDGDALVNTKTGWRESLSNFAFSTDSHKYRRDEL